MPIPRKPPKRSATVGSTAAIFRHPDVAEVAVFGIPHPTWIEAVTAIVVLKSGASLSVSDLMTYCRETLSHFKAPKHIEIVPDLPKNASGKILKRELRLSFSNVFDDKTA